MQNAKTTMTTASRTGANRLASVDDKSYKSTPDPDRTSTFALDQFAHTTRLAIKMQNVKERLDSVLVRQRFCVYLSTLGESC